ncbi:MAG: hypothetical protein WKH64_13375 [Chloroflexia bacterium]
MQSAGIAAYPANRELFDPHSAKRASIARYGHGFGCGSNEQQRSTYVLEVYPRAMIRRLEGRPTVQGRQHRWSISAGIASW